MSYTVPHFINGKLHHPADANKLNLHNPAFGEICGELYLADNFICDEAIWAAQKAFPNWSQTTATKRAQIFFKFRNLLETHQQDIARLVTQEHGKTLDDAKGSVGRAIELVEYYCGLTSLLQTSYSANVSRGIDSYTIEQPLGLCAGISPFNFPVMIPIWMIIPAIACGNTFILKPSEQTPSASLRLFELLHDAGLPDGVANCVQGDKTAAHYLMTHPDISAITAVGSTAISESIYKQSIAAGKRSQTFGGAKNHAVVMPDADFNETAKAIVGAAFGSAGERCMAISVVVAVGDETADKLLTSLKPLIRNIKIGPGQEEQVDMGPLVSSVQRQRVIDAIESGVLEGATLLMDGRHFKHETCPLGYFLGPSLFDHVTESMTIYQEEIFGPVLCLVRVKHLKEAIELVNRHPYGNGSSIFTKDGYTAHVYTESIHIGMVGINIPIPVPAVTHPFGGWKKSAFGDTNMHGKESLRFYTRRKTITARWPGSSEGQNGFTMPIHS